jgi:hypothetical protein
MYMKNIYCTLLALLLVLGANVAVMAQEVVDAPKPRLSAVAISRTMVGDTYVKVVYGQPLKKGRVIFGELEPYGKVWRTGANESTEITFSTDVTFGGTRVSAGTYSLFTIPNKDSWTIILNRALGQSGAFQYDESKDVVRFEAPVKASQKMYEAFTISFTEAEGGTDLHMMWDLVHITAPIRL